MPERLKSDAEITARWRLGATSLAVSTSDNMLIRLQQIDNSGNAILRLLKAELSAYPFAASPTPPGNLGRIALLLRLRVSGLAAPL